ncbi:MAG: helix-turn-helix transcriptional regulator [Desulfosarcina sp.]|nr:helix-turn-helix transcriptional regulator [Desulfosarcina sp.]
MEEFLIMNNLRKVRHRISWPQWKLALAAGIAESRISVIEQGAPPRMPEMNKLSNALAVPINEIWPTINFHKERIS